MTCSGNSLYNNKYQKYLLGIAILFVFVLTYILNKFYPLVCEDWSYALIWGVDEPTRVKSLWDVLASQYHHYIIWGGRSVAHVIAQILLAFDPLWHDIINALAYTLFTYLVYKFINFGHETRSELYLLISLLLWFALPEIISLTVWITYSAVYLWTTLFTVLFLYPYYKAYLKNDSKSNFLKSVGLFFFGIIAGWSNENLAFMMLLFLASLLILMKYQKKKIPLWMFFGLVGAVIGAAFLVLAPGNFARMAVQPSTSFMILSKLKGLVLNYLYNLTLISLLYISLLYFYFKKSTSQNKKETIAISLLFFVSAHMASLVMVVFPIFQARSLFGPITFIIIGLGIVLANLPLKRELYCKLNIIILSILIVGFGFDYYDKYKYLVYFDDFWHRREVYLLEEKKKGVIDIVYDEDLVFKNGFILFDFKRFPDGWPNVDYARYYEVNSVVLK